MASRREEIEAGRLRVLLLDECHLLWGDSIGYVWGRTDTELTVPITNERHKQTYYGAVDYLVKQLLSILVIGATGNQGGAVARHLLQRGNFTVRAFVRDPNKPAAQALKQASAELAEGDLNDRASLDRALQGASGVFSVQTFQDGLDAEIREGKTLADAAKAAGIQHFVYSSVGSAERNTGVPHFDSKFQIEEYIRASGLPHDSTSGFLLLQLQCNAPDGGEGNALPTTQS